MTRYQKKYLWKLIEPACILLGAMVFQFLIRPRITAEPVTGEWYVSYMVVLFTAVGVGYIAYDLFVALNPERAKKVCMRWDDERRQLIRRKMGEGFTMSTLGLTVVFMLISSYVDLPAVTVFSFFIAADLLVYGVLFLYYRRKY